MDSQEVAPRSLAALGSRIKTMLDEDVLHRLAADRADAELFQFAENAGIAPAGFFGNHHNQFADDGRQAWPAFPGRPFAVLLPDPAAESGVADDGDRVPNGRTNLLSQLQQLRPLVGVEKDVLLGHPLAEHFIFGFEELDLLLEIVRQWNGPARNSNGWKRRTILVKCSPISAKMAMWQSFCTPVWPGQRL